jgi:hypothetical protein
VGDGQGPALRLGEDHRQAVGREHRERDAPAGRDQRVALADLAGGPPVGDEAGGPVNLLRPADPFLASPGLAAASVIVLAWWRVVNAWRTPAAASASTVRWVGGSPW